MAEVLIYRQISFDTARVTSSQSPFCPTLFEATRYPYIDGSTRVTEFEEKAIVRWLMLCPASRHIVFDELGLPPAAFYGMEIVRPFYASGEGDIDLILCPRGSPNRAVALECKRVKVEIVNAGQDKINKLQGVAEGVRQANKLYKGRLAFFQTYLAIITEVAAPAQEGEDIPMRGLRPHSTPQRGDTKSTTFRQIVEFPGRDDLDDEVGIVFIEVVQPSRLTIDSQATVRVCVYRRAEKRDQMDTVTNRTIELLDHQEMSALSDGRDP